MEPPLLRVLLIRGILVLAPFAIWFVWRWWARRSGHEMGSTPWPWLAAAGAALLGLSLVATVVFHPDNRHERYVPGETTASGTVTKGRFEPAPNAPIGPPK
jgi:TRAP-type C4-dicarboxylate transport system permease small subunit